MRSAVERAEPIASGEVLDGSTLAGSPFCTGGTIAGTHASNDPAMEPYGLIDRTITCPDGSVRLGLTPSQAQGLKQSGSWIIVSGTGAFKGIHGSGKMEVCRSRTQRRTSSCSSARSTTCRLGTTESERGARRAESCGLAAGCSGSP